MSQLDQAIEQIADAEYKRLRAKFPALTNYLDMTILVVPVFGGAFDVAGELYGSQSAAYEARKAAIMFELSRIERL